MQSENLTSAEATTLLELLKPITSPHALDKTAVAQRAQFTSMLATVKGILNPTGVAISQAKSRLLQACAAIDARNGEDYAKIPSHLIEKMDDVLNRVRGICNGSHEAICQTDVPTATISNLDTEIIDFGRIHGILTQSMIMEDTLDNLQYLAGLQHGHVLIRGETGTGKELFSKAIHTASKRAHKPYVIVDGAAADLNLIKDELLGHEKGAFTGADKKKMGKLEAAGEGVVFIDEIGKWSFEAQGILLSVLAGREMERIGSNGNSDNKFKMNARIVAATNADLEDLVNKGLFLEDLYYRLLQLRIDLPPLRERGTQDVEILAKHFLEAAKTEQMIGYKITMEPDAMEELKKFEWPGNVRQLKHVTEQALVNANRERARQKRLAKEKNGEMDPLDIMLHHVNNALEPYKRITLRAETTKKNA